MDNLHCRFCGKKLSHTFIDLGLSPVSNEYVSKEQLEEGHCFYPLNVKVCDSCFYVQALTYKKPENIFTDYKYFSSFSESWLNHCHKYVDMISKRLNLDENSMVYEIACNDGYLLQYFKPYNIPVCGIEPAANVAQEAKKKGIEVEVEFWGKDTARKITKKHGQADLIIGNNVLAHVPDINSFVEGISTALKSSGTVTIEFPSLMNLVSLNQFDTIYHEHFSYLSLSVVKRIFNKHNMEIYDVEELSTHGGSLRIYATYSDNTSYDISQNVYRLLEKEEKAGVNSLDYYTRFTEKVLKIKIDSCRVLGELKSSGARIVAFGAAAKGNTFLNYCGIGKEYIDFVADSSSAKQGLYLPGTLIPILSPDEIKKRKPDYILLLAWNLKDEFVELLSYTRSWGCKFITLIPEVNIF